MTIENNQQVRMNIDATLVAIFRIESKNTKITQQKLLKSLLVSWYDMF